MGNENDLQIEVLDINEETDYSDQGAGGDDKGDNKGDNGAGNEGVGAPGNDKTEFNREEFLKTEFGEEYASADAIKGLIESNKKLSGIKPEHIDLATKIAGTNSGWLVDYIHGGGKDIPFVMELMETKPEELSDFDAVLKHAVLHNKNKDVSKETIENVLRKKYNMLEEPESSSLGRKYFDDELNEGKYLLSQDAAAARKGIVDFQNENKLTPAQKEQQATAQNEAVRLKTWEPEIVKGFDGIKQAEKLKFGDVEIDVSFDWKPDEDTQKEFKQIFENVVRKNVGLPHTEKNVELLKDFATTLFVGKYKERMITEAFKSAVLASAKKFASKYGGVPAELTFDTSGNGGNNNKIEVVRIEEKQDPKNNR